MGKTFRMRKFFNTRFYTLLTLLAFSINTILPFFAVYNVAANEASHVSSLFGEKILICSGEGFRWVKLADLQSGKEKPKPHSGDQCPLCYAANHGLKAITLAALFIVPAADRSDAPIFISYQLPLSFHLASALNARAPPFSFA